MLEAHNNFEKFLKHLPFQLWPIIAFAEDNKYLYCMTSLTGISDVP